MKITADHPSLAGHFPGNPIVPGVVLLDEVIAAFREHIGKPLIISAMPNIKFVSPLLPEQEFVVSFEQKKEGLASFSMQSGDTVIVSGQLRYSLCNY